MYFESSNGTLSRHLLLSVCVLTLCIFISTWLVSTGDFSVYGSEHVPPGQVLYILSKLCALVAFVMLWFQCIAALARFSPALRRFAQFSRRQHAALGSATFAATIAHVVLFIAASTLRTHHSTVGQLIPRFDQGFYTSRISIGVVAFWLLCLVVMAGWLRLRGLFALRWVHRAGLIVFALGFFHGIAIGSETRFGSMKYVYVALAATLGAAALSWVVLLVKQRWAR